MDTLTFILEKFRRDHGLTTHRLRGPMPIEVANFNRNDLAKLMGELGFCRGAEIGVAEGHYSEVLCQNMPDLNLMAVDPWMRYRDNPRAHSQEHQDFSKAETERRLAPYPHARMVQAMSMDAVRDVREGTLDFVYIDGHHSYDWVMGDLIEWSRRVRSGGIVAGDDFYHFDRAGVVQAVNNFTEAHEISPWFLIQAPRSVDFMWVKS